jgi:phage shock protein PspC (stress-responsive transcriptional regulator)
MGAALYLALRFGFTMNALLTLIVGAAIGAIGYVLAWLCLPGGRTELTGLVADVRSSIGR